MKRLLAYVFLVLGLLWCNPVFSKILNFENRVLIEVPNKYEYIESDSASELIADAKDSDIFGQNTRFFLVGTKNSIEFTKSFIDDPEDLFQTIIDKMETKNFTSEKQMTNFMGKEMNKLLKKNKYTGVIWILFGEDKIEDLDQELIEIVEEIRSMDDAEIKSETRNYKKTISNEIITPETKNMIKIKKFIIEKDEYNNPTMQLNLSYNVPPLKGSVEFYAFIKDDMPIMVSKECLGACKSGIKSLKKMIKPTFASLKSIEKKSVSSNIIEELNQLNELYKSGALTKEEFEKAKKKILN